MYKVSPHGKLPIPIDEDYNNIDPNTYEGGFYQEQGLPGEFDILFEELDGPVPDARSDGEVVKGLKDIDMLEKLRLDDDGDDRQEEPLPLYTRDSDDDTPQHVDSDYDDDYF